MKIYIYVLIFLTGTQLFSQSNLFLNRSFWEKKPSIKEIEKNSSDVNSLTELNIHSFDAVGYAILSKLPNATLKYLIDLEGNGVHKLTHDKRTYVFWAAYKDNTELMEYVIDKGARMDIKDAHHFSVSTFAAVTGNTDEKIYEICSANGINIKTDVDGNGANALLLLMPYVRKLSELRYFEGKGLSINDRDSLGNNAINYAAKTGNIKVIKKLLKKNISATVTDSKGNNAILMASMGTRNKTNSLETFEFLKDLGVEVSVTNNLGVNSIHNLAFDSEDTNVFDFFEVNGIVMDASDDAGNTPYMNAAKYNTEEIVHYFSEKTVEKNKKNAKGYSALTNAVRYNTAKIVTQLIKKGSDVNVEDMDGNNLVYYLIQSYRSSQVESFQNKMKALEVAGLDFSKKQKNNSNCLHLAVEKNDLKLVKMLEGFPTNINEKDADGLTSLHKAAMSGVDDSILKYLVFIGADKNIKTGFGETAFDLAQENEVLKMNNINVDFLKFDHEE